MKKYFLYELKKSGYTIACLTVICTIVYLLAILTTDVKDLGYAPYYTHLIVIVVAGGVLAFCIPFIQFDYKMKKRSADLFFALPLSHTKILTVKYLIGLIMVFAPYIIAYIIGAIAVTMRVDNPIYNSEYYNLHLLSTLIPIYIIYAVSSFAYTRADRALDGVLNAVCWGTVLAVITLVISLFTTRQEIHPEYEYTFMMKYVRPEYYLLFMPLSTCTEYFAELMVSYYLPMVNDTVNMAVGFTLTGLMGIGATVGLFVLEKQAKFENIEQSSKSPFGLTVMIPLFTVCISAISAIEVSLFISCAIAMYLVTAYYKRTLKIGKWQTIILVSSLVAGLIIGVIGYYA